MEGKRVILTGNDLTINDVFNVAVHDYFVEIDEGALIKVKEANDAIKKMVDDDIVAYGITTGFGYLQNKVIDKSDASRLSRNLVISHAVALGKPMSTDVVRAAIVIRINALIKGHSGVSVELINALCELLNKQVTPVIPMLGSLACSGDLCLLAHLALTITEPNDEDDTADNDVFYKNKRIPSILALKKTGIKRVKLGPKEGLALTNGSTFTAAVACLAYMQAANIFKMGIIACGLTLEALTAVPDAFDSRIHDLRGHEGQKEFARCIRATTSGSKLMGSSKNVQDAYSLRCASQVQGTLYDCLAEFEKVLTIEINSVTDNPIMVKEEKGYKILSGGNFHGEPLAIIIDHLKCAITETGAISERRTFRLLDKSLSNGLPPMLAIDAGLNSGYMIAQYTSASLCLQNQQYAQPASVLSLPTCANSEDHNSNAWNGAINLMDIIDNVKRILYIETLCATRGIELRLLLNSLEESSKKYKESKEESKESEKMEDSKDSKESKVLLAKDCLGKWTSYAYSRFSKCLDPRMYDHLIRPEIIRIQKIYQNEIFMEEFNKVITEQDVSRAIDIPRGTRDFNPQQMVVRKQCMKQVEDIFVKHGAVTIDTPTFELQSVLFGKYGSQQKLVFDLDDQGGAKCSLRYDLTVPLARYVAMHGIARIKRYQMAYVFRRDNPSIAKGRYRQFMQLDYDCVGNNDLMVDDADTLSVIAEILDSFKLNYTIKFNHKGLLDLILIGCGVPQDKLKTVCSSIDKLDKDSWDKIAIELKHKEIDEKVIRNIETKIQFRGEPSTILETLYTEFKESEEIIRILNDIKLLFSYLESLDCLSKLTFDTSLARGLDYYTGIIFEAVMLEKDCQVGSIAGGGRYDNLIGMFGRRQIPAVGGSIGIERIFTILEARMAEQKQNISQTKCYVTFIKDRKDDSKNIKLFNEVLKITNQLWKAGISAEMVMQKDTVLKVQIEETLKKGIPYMIIVGETELAEDKLIIKDLFANGGKGKQDKIDRQDLIKYFSQV